MLYLTKFKSSELIGRGVRTLRLQPFANAFVPCGCSPLRTRSYLAGAARCERVRTLRVQPVTNAFVPCGCSPLRTRSYLAGAARYERVRTLRVQPVTNAFVPCGCSLLRTRSYLAGAARYERVRTLRVQPVTNGRRRKLVCHTYWIIFLSAADLRSDELRHADRRSTAGDLKSAPHADVGTAERGSRSHARCNR